MSYVSFRKDPRSKSGKTIHTEQNNCILIIGKTKNEKGFYGKNVKIVFVGDTTQKFIKINVFIVNIKNE